MALGSRPKPPAEGREDLLDAVAKGLERHSKEEAVWFLLRFFTNIDLVGIRDDLRKDATTEQLKREVGK